MRALFLAAVGLTALVGAGGLALAQQAGSSGPDAPPPHARFFEADANHDGAVSRAEFDAFRTAEFARLDANHDGSVSREERRAAHPEGHGHHGQHDGDCGRGGPGGREWGEGRHGDHLERADANHDGNITREEFLAGPTRMFDVLDANHDGVISADERASARQRMDGERREAREHRPHPDANNDGLLSRTEWNQAGAAMFDQLDANHDGRVTEQEAEAARPHGRGR